MFRGEKTSVFWIGLLIAVDAGFTGAYTYLDLLLEEHGITDKRRKNECFLAMTRRGIKYFVGLQKDLEPD